MDGDDEIPEETWEDFEIDPEWLKREIEDLKEREKESTGVDPAFAQRIRAEELSKRLYMLYGIRIGTLDLMTALMYTGVKLALDSLGHVQAGYDSLTYEPAGEEVVDLQKYRVSRRIDK
jgi:hypothetical protein